MTNAKTPRKLTATGPDAAQEARDQADAYDSLFADTPLELDDGTIMMNAPHPEYGMLDDEQMDAWDELQYEVDTEYDREPDIFIPEQKLDNGIMLPAETQRGALLRPYRKTVGDVTSLVKPSHSIRVVQAALGDAKYKELRAGGRSAADVWKIWGKQGLKVKERQASDSKSASSTVDLETVSEADS